jgi:uncharacterized protein YndB with AHSA1/START domain
MTTQKSFKRLVRTRMAKTGERYTAARAMLLAAGEPSGNGSGPVLTVSDDAIRRRTGRGWEELFELLDDWGRTEHTHTEIARWLREEQEIDGWGSQAITVSYERARGMREVGEHADGFAVTASRTVAAPAEELFAAFADPGRRVRWLPDAELRERTATPPRSIRYDWEDGSSRVNVFVDAKGAAKSTVHVSHERLPDSGEAARMKSYWRDRVGALKVELERSGASRRAR